MKHENEEIKKMIEQPFSTYNTDTQIYKKEKKKKKMTEYCDGL